MGLLQDSRTLVTGGTADLGFAIAERFLAEGARVVITSGDVSLGRQAERALGPGARFVVADVADHLGGLDVLVNNAGVGVTARLIDTRVADHDRVMNINVVAAVFYASRESEFITGTTLLVDGGMTAGYLQRERAPEPL